jgi:branched-chain amino acid transport system substrate-binding protein
MMGFVIGPACPEAAVAASPIYAKACVLQFVPAVTAVEFTRPGCDYLFRMAANDEQEAQALSEFLARKHKGKKLAVVYTDVFFRRAFVGRLKESLSRDAATLARFEPLLDVPGAYDRMAAKLQKEPVDVIYLALENQATVEFVGKLRQRGVPGLLVGGQRLLSTTFWGAARDAAENIHVIAPIESLSKPQFLAAVDLLRQSNVVPDLVALNSFASVQTWAEAVRQAGSGHPKEVMEFLRTRTFDTAIGPVAFDQRGDRRDIRFSVLVWQSGRLKDSLEWSR